MARYYDIDKLKEMVETKADTLIEGKEAFLYVAKWLDLLPTADVVPKSEVDRAYQRGFERGKRDNVCGFSAEDIARKGEQLAIELEAMRTAANSYKMHYEKAEAEVERLQHILDSYALQYGTVMDKHIVIERARAEVAREVFEEIEKVVGYALCVDLTDWSAYTDLKKKYTEGENEDQRGSY